MENRIDAARLANQRQLGEYARDLVNNPYWDLVWMALEREMLEAMATTEPDDDAGRRHWHAQIAAIRNLRVVLQGMVEEGGSAEHGLQMLMPKGEA